MSSTVMFGCRNKQKVLIQKGLSPRLFRGLAAVYRFVYIIPAACETLTSLPHHKIQHTHRPQRAMMYSLRGVVLRLSNKRRANAAAEEAALSANREAAIAALLLLFMPCGVLLLYQARGNQSCNAIDRKLDDPDFKEK